MKAWHTTLRSIGIATISLCAFAWGGAWAQGIEATPHNLGSGGPGPNTFGGTAEICVFCHTPHAGDTSAEVPLWNRTLAAPGTYTTYSTVSSSSIDGEVAPVGSVSIACLSCHDGTQAMDSIINTPGSGTDPVGFSSGTWTAGGPNITGIANIGADLTNDHPIGIQYGGGGISTAAPAGAMNDPDFNAPQNQVINTTTVWWVDSEAAPNATRNKTDMQLYTRSVAAIDGGTAQPFVECASCHDPHSSNETFLRISNDNSAVCLACHNK